MKCVIVIDGESAKELFAVGCKDLRDYFLPEDLHVKATDVSSIHFEELRRNGKEISFSEAILSSEPYEVITNKENFHRDKV